MLTVRDCPTVAEKFMKMLIIVVFFLIKTRKSYEATPIPRSSSAT